MSGKDYEQTEALPVRWSQGNPPRDAPCLIQYTTAAGQFRISTGKHDGILWRSLTDLHHIMDPVCSPYHDLRWCLLALPEETPDASEAQR